MLTYFDFDGFYSDAKRIAAVFERAKLSVIGQSQCKRDIFSLSIGSGESTVLFLGSMRGNDAISAAVLLRFFERLCVSDKNCLKISAIKTSNILREQKITVIPVVNPDGIEIHTNGVNRAGRFRELVKLVRENNPDKPWCSNARGVEPYLNFDFYFPLTDTHCIPSSCGNCGPSAESEPETRAVADFVRKNDIKYSILLSANGEKIIYSENGSSEAALMAQIFKSISGFPVLCREEKSRNGNYCEWFTHNFKKASFEFSFENQALLNREGLEEMYMHNEELLMLSAIM